MSKDILRRYPHQSKTSLRLASREVVEAPAVLPTRPAVRDAEAERAVERPEIDRDVCTRCGICFVRCPDGAIALDDEGYPVIDYDHCKGCMECWEQCPVEGALRREREVRAW